MVWVAPQEVTGATIGCATVGAGLGASISQLTVSLWCDAAAGIHLGVNTGGGVPPGGLFLIYSYGGSNIVAPGETVFPQLILNARNHAGNLINDREWTSPPTLYFDEFRADGTRAYSSELINYLISIDFTTQTTQVYCNDTLMSVTSDAAHASGSFANTAGTWSLTPGAGFGFADLWMRAGTALDLSIAANRRCFINADKSSVALASDGSITADVGTVSPQVYLHVDTYQSGAPTDFLTNHGSGPDWTVNSGSLAWHADSVPDQVNGLQLDPPVVTAPDYSLTTNPGTEVDGTAVATIAYATFDYTGTPDASLRYELDTPASLGTAVVNSDGSFSYTPNDGVSDTSDSFTYRALVFDGTISDPGTVNILINPSPSVDMAVILLPNAEVQFIDGNGLPYAAGTLEMYERDTTTPKNTWIAPEGGDDNLNTNPITLDSAGRAIIYGDGAYRTVLRDADGNLIWDQPSFTYVSSAMAPVVGAADLATARQAMGVTDAIEAEAEARAAADSAEASARASADATLQSNIDAEIARAEAAEAALGARIDGLPAPAPPGNTQGAGGTLDASGHTRVTFGTPFATDGISVVITGQALGVQSGAFNVANLDRFGFDVWGSIFGSRTPASGVEFYWLAIGD